MHELLSGSQPLDDATKAVSHLHGFPRLLTNRKALSGWLPRNRRRSLKSGPSSPFGASLQGWLSPFHVLFEPRSCFLVVGADF